MGLLVLLGDHRGREDIARLGDDLDLEIDEILPSTEFAEVLGLLTVEDGQVALTDTGRRLLAGSIRERKALLREQLKKTTLFRALLRALESDPEHRLSETEVDRLIAFTTAPADEYVQNIINWGRYAELFRYDSDARVLLPIRPRAGARPPSPPSHPAPPVARTSASPSKSGASSPPANERERVAPVTA